jgi:hypothetical protein
MKPITVGGILVEKHLTKFKPRWRLLGFGVAYIWPHEWCITWDYCPCLLSQQLWLIFERKKKMVHVLHVGGGIWDCNSYVPTSLLC